MTRPRAAAVTLALLLSAGALVASPENQPYAGQEARDVSSLSPQDIDDLLAGRGWGFALPAELNGYPGPLHVLEAADELKLTDAQRSAIEEVFERMNAAARALGRGFIDAEAALDAAFAERTITPEALAKLTAEVSRIEAELRATHLAAHLEVTPLLTRHQIATYNTLRGYGGAAAGGHSGHGGH